jgi:hypothetical protein
LPRLLATHLAGHFQQVPVIFTIDIKFNTVLGIRLFSHFFDGSYQPRQNDEAFAFVDALIGTRMSIMTVPTPLA